MDSKKYEHFKKKLLEKKSDLFKTVSKTEQYGREADEDATQDIADKAANSYTKEFLFSQSSNERSTLQLINEALERLESGNFGSCVSCDNEIQQKRLEAVPWTRHCISCQELQEQGLLQEEWGLGFSPAHEDRCLKSLSQTITPLVDSLLSIVFPCSCRLCQGIVAKSSLGVVCQDCWNKIKAIEDPFCAVCGYPFVSQNVELGALCGSCRHQLFAFDFARSYSSFSDPLKEIIHQFKYWGHLSLARPLGRYLQAVYHSFPECFRSNVIIPIPLHRTRERARGFNQAAELAKQLSRLTLVPFQSDWLVRTRPTEVQAGLSRRQRRLNLKGAFQVSARAALANCEVLLLDDVFTTGATLNECATILKRSGCRRVNVLTVARVTRD